MNFTEMGEHTFRVREKLPSGMTVQVEFSAFFCESGEVYFDAQDRYFFNVDLVTYRKRKHVNDTTYTKTTGQDGLKPLLFGLKAVREFENHLKENYVKGATIFVSWEDGQRRRVYTRYLEREGYHVMSNGDLGSGLIKQVV